MYGVNRSCGSSRTCCGKHKATCAQCAWQCWQKSGIKRRDLLIHTPLPMCGSARRQYEPPHYLLVNLLCWRNMPLCPSDRTVTGTSYFQVLQTLPVLQCLRWFSGCDELWNPPPPTHTHTHLSNPNPDPNSNTDTQKPFCVHISNTWRPLCVHVTDWILCFLEGSLNFFVSFVSWVIGGGARHFGRLKAGEKKVAFS